MLRNFLLFGLFYNRCIWKFCNLCFGSKGWYWLYHVWLIACQVHCSGTRLVLPLPIIEGNSSWARRRLFFWSNHIFTKRWIPIVQHPDSKSASMNDAIGWSEFRVAQPSRLSPCSASGRSTFGTGRGRLPSALHSLLCKGLERSNGNLATWIYAGNWRCCLRIGNIEYDTILDVTREELVWRHTRTRKVYYTPWLSLRGQLFAKHVIISQLVS